MRRKRLIMMIGSILLLNVCDAYVQAQAFQQVHDPSDPVFHEGKWWIHTTGDGIYTMHNTTLTPLGTWTPGPRVFPGAHPSWINDYVPDFAGHFWAPHLTSNRVYYSCSSFGSKVSAIGMAEGSPGGTYEDRGIVVYSNRNTNQGNAIDPFVFDDYLIYGSWFDGIFMVQLGEDGKPSTDVRTRVVAGGRNDAEAAFMTRNGDYYYLWFNRGKCCDGINSTYYLQVGRSKSITGPFADSTGQLLTSGGGTTVLSTSGRYIGPGGSGVLDSILVWHFYDRSYSGYPRLMVGTIAYPNGWPCVTPQYGDGGGHCTPPQPKSPLEPNVGYRITPRHSAKTIEVKDCEGQVGTNVVQWEWMEERCQEWLLTPLESNYWRISPQNAPELALSVTGSERGANVMLTEYRDTTDRQWKLIYHGNGNYQLRARNCNLCLDINANSTLNGANALVWDCISLANNQLFGIAIHEDDGPPVNAHITLTNNASTSIRIYPNPVTDGTLRVEMDMLQASTSVRMYDSSGRLVRLYPANSKLMEIMLDVPSGLYLIHVVSGAMVVGTKRVSVMR